MDRAAAEAVGSDNEHGCKAYTFSGLTGTATPDVQDNFPVYGEVSENEKDLQALRA